MTGSLIARVTAIGVAVWASFVLFWHIRTAPLFIDEPTYTRSGWRYVERMLGHPGPVSNFEHPPLAKLLFGIGEHVVGHPSVAAARVVAATCTLATAALIGWWIATIAGQWHGIAAAALVALVPTPIWPQLTDFGRAAMLDPVAELFMVASVAASWFWFGKNRAQPWLWALATGLATGLATAAKENGFLGVIGPIAIGLLSERTLRRIGQAVVAVVTAGFTFLATYLPIGQPLLHAQQIVRFQWRHRETGHLIGLPHRVTSHPPWWTNFWYANQSWGTVLSLTVLACAAAGVVLCRDRLTAWLLAALAGPVLFHCVIAGIALSFYWVMWTPALLALAGRGIVALTQRRRTIAGAVLALVIVGSVSVNETIRVATMHVEGPQAVAQLRAAAGLRGQIASTGISGSTLKPFLGSVLGRLPADVTSIDTVLIGPPRCRRLFSAEIRALVAVNLANGRLHRAHHDRMVDVYVADAPLLEPTAEQVAAEPPSRLTDNC